MRRRSWYGWHWSTWQERDGRAHCVVARRQVWDVRCLEAVCGRVSERMTARSKPARGRWRAGGRYR